MASLGLPTVGAGTPMTVPGDATRWATWRRVVHLCMHHGDHAIVCFTAIRFQPEQRPPLALWQGESTGV